MGLMRQTLLKRLNETHNDTPEQRRPPVRRRRRPARPSAKAAGCSSSKNTSTRRPAARRSTPSSSASAPARTRYSITEPDPTGHSYGKAIGKALADANLPPAGGRPARPLRPGDPRARPRRTGRPAHVFGGGLERVPLSPIKAQIGNLAAGSGVDAAAAVLALQPRQDPAGGEHAKVIDGQT